MLGLGLLYRLYERRLLREVRGGVMPRHIGLILDGNRRYARELGFSDLLEGHRRGADRLERVLDWLEELEIRIITIYVLSTENLSRPPEELQALLGLIEARMRSVATDPKIHAKGVRVRAVGQLDLLPRSVQDAIRAAEEATAAYGSFFLNIAVGYGGRQEIAHAVQALLLDRSRRGMSLEGAAADVTPEAIGKYLYTYDLPDPDLIIRTSGEFRLSGFLLWQSAYSEFYFCDAYWPAFRKIDLLRAVRAYQQRKRRFGT
ncbi:MAG: di-trans,poly-cis-decaprenylcistransferase [candidate division NC10 bacterium]|nr:di-trans,poly-cis-decaprenylcistransferase [candidate division NC10 bacterium]MBI3002668.1 di-trans,poly-cis-decaprenylcistransferase [candidate division NC10 bacterium]